MGSHLAVTRDGREVAEPIPESRRHLVSREEFAAASNTAPTVNLEAFRADQDAAIDNAAIGPYDR